MTDKEYLQKYVDPMKLEEAYQKLEQGLPVQYIVGTMNFYGYEFQINEHVLIPRFETEELVARTIRYIKEYQLDDPTILDIGTGSGCIAITLSKELQKKVDALDISGEALQVAQENNKKLKADVTFYESDLFEKITKQYDVIISNPPYIDPKEKIDEVVFKHEPHLALFAEDHGLYFYKEMIHHLLDYTKEKALIAFEIGESQAEEIIAYAKEKVHPKRIWKEKDLAGFDRYIFLYLEK